MPNFLNKKNLAYTTLAAAIDNSQTTITVKPGTGSNLADAPCLAKICEGFSLAQLLAGESIKITSKVDDTLTVTRSGSPKAHIAGSLILDVISVEHFIDLQDQIDDAQFAAALGWGIAVSGVRQLTMDRSDLAVTEQDTPNMTVQVAIGYAMINRKFFKLPTIFNTPTIVAPAQMRIDLVQAKLLGHTIDVKTGIEHPTTPVAPTADSDCLALATIALDNTTTEITDSEITDVRLFY